MYVYTGYMFIYIGCVHIYMDMYTQAPNKVWNMTPEAREEQEAETAIREHDRDRPPGHGLAKTSDLLLMNFSDFRGFRLMFFSA